MGRWVGGGGVKYDQRNEEEEKYFNFRKWGKMQKKYIEFINQIKSPYLSGFDLITFQIDKHGNYAEL